MIGIVKEYLEKMEAIRKKEFLSRAEVFRDINISYATINRIEKNPESCSFKTMRKIKKFVDEWEFKNQSSVV